jgi:hypothetical protein
MPQVWVDDDADAARARAVIEAFALQAQASAPLACPACGEENPGSFDLCWSCGAGLETSNP